MIEQLPVVGEMISLLTQLDIVSESSAIEMRQCGAALSGDVDGFLDLRSTGPKLHPINAIGRLGAHIHPVILDRRDWRFQNGDTGSNRARGCLRAHVG